MLQAFFIKVDDLNGSTTKNTGDESPHERDRDCLRCEDRADGVILVFPISFSNELVSS